MNPDQLWETTLDRDARTLLQVKIGDVSEVDEIFSKLMGDVVEPRREFIQENALTVANLDVWSCARHRLHAARRRRGGSASCSVISSVHTLNDVNVC